ncbi:hypothetical protein [Clostridium guangxiense]|nr:hypothetical protein [Clostridium guangxiense]
MLDIMKSSENNKTLSSSIMVLTGKITIKSYDGKSIYLLNSRYSYEK